MLIIEQKEKQLSSVLVNGKSACTRLEEQARQRRDKGFGEVLCGNGEVLTDFAIPCQKV